MSTDLLPLIRFLTAPAFLLIYSTEGLPGALGGVALLMIFELTGWVEQRISKPHSARFVFFHEITEGLAPFTFLAAFWKTGQLAAWMILAVLFRDLFYSFLRGLLRKEAGQNSLHDERFKPAANRMFTLAAAVVNLAVLTGAGFEATPVIRILGMLLILVAWLSLAFFLRRNHRLFGNLDY